MNTADPVATVGEVDAFLEKYDRAISADIMLRDHSLKILHGLVHLARIHPCGDFYDEPLPEHLQVSFEVIQNGLAVKARPTS